LWLEIVMKYFTVTDPSAGGSDTKETDMNTAEKSLRYLVEKWLAPNPTMSIHVVQFGRISLDKRRYVRVEASAPTGSRAMFFFRHDDGCWCVFPPAIARPAMMGHRLRN
jgi:hypothetical protein